MTERKETFIPFLEIPVTLAESQEITEIHPAELELLKQLTASGPLRVPRRGNYYHSIKERANQLELSLTHDQIYQLALLLNRNANVDLGKIKNSKEIELDPSTWSGTRATLFNLIRNMFPESAFANPASLKTNTGFIDELNSRLQSLKSQERRIVLEWLRDNTARFSSLSKLRIEVSDQHYSLSYYNASGLQEFIGDRRQLYSDVSVVTSKPRTAKENLERVIKEFQDMPANANDFARARLYRNLIRAIATNQSGNSINWRELKIADKALQEIVCTKGMSVEILGPPGAEKLTLLVGSNPTRAVFEMYATEVGAGQVLNQNNFRGAYLAEGLRLAMLETTAPQTVLTHLRHIATSLKTATSPEIYNEILSSINKSLELMVNPMKIEIQEGQVKLSRNGMDIPNMCIQMETGTALKPAIEGNRLQTLLENPERTRVLRKAIESLATAQTPMEKMQAAAVYLQEGVERISFTQDSKTYTINFRITKVDGDLKNVEINMMETDSLKSVTLAKGVILIRGKNVRVIESATAA